MNDDLVTMLNNAFHGRGWQGPTLLGSLRGVSAPEALVAPPPLKHNIWQLALHAAYWKYAICLKIEKAGVRSKHPARGESADLEFPRSPSNFPNPPRSATTKTWRADIDLLKSYHDALIDAVGRLSAKQLDAVPPGGKSWPLRPVIIGVAAHDAYHCGQIQILKRLIRGGRGRA